MVDLIEKVVRLFEDVLRERPEEWHLSAPIWRMAGERLGARASK